MELRHLRYFLAVAETLSFRGAAERLRMAQPPLSAQIKALERELEVRLLERTTRSVRLTAAGRAFLQDAQALLAAADQARQRARDAHHGVTGTLRIGMLASVANAWLAGILRRFRAQFPGLQLSLFDLTSAEQLRRLRTRELDAGLLRPPVSDAELEHRFVAHYRQVLALPAGHRLATKSRLLWRDFHEQPLVLIHPAVQHGFYDPFFAACAKAGARLGPAQYANDIQTKIWLVAAGFGIAPTTVSVAEVKRPGLVFRPLPPGLPPVQIALAWHRHDSPPALAHFLENFPPAG